MSGGYNGMWLNTKLYFYISDCAGCNTGKAECSTQNKCTTQCGHITSINYPLPYSPNERCHWHIVVVPDEYIVLIFHEFDVRSESKSCESDSLDVYDYSVIGEETRIGSFCNYVHPPHTLLSSWSQLRLLMASDFDINGKGFHASYQSMKYKINDDTSSERGRYDIFDF